MLILRAYASDACATMAYFIDGGGGGGSVPVSFGVRGKTGRPRTADGWHRENNRFECRVGFRSWPVSNELIANPSSEEIGVFLFYYITLIGNDCDARGNGPYHTNPSVMRWTSKLQCSKSFRVDFQNSIPNNKTVKQWEMFDFFPKMFKTRVSWCVRVFVCGRFELFFLLCLFR